MNGKVGAVIGNPRVGNALFWCIGAVMALLIGASRMAGRRAERAPAASIRCCSRPARWAPRWYSGLRGSFLRSAPQQMTVMLLTGQILSAMLLSHFGWLGSPVAPVSLTNVMGALLMIGGVFLATR